MAVRDTPRVVIVGGGGTGAALAHDLVLRGIGVVLVERWGLCAGTTGRHHGLLHSGARYAVTDPESAEECIRENRILRRIAPGSFEENDGLFVALTDEDLAFRDPLLEACDAAGIPVSWMSPREALRHEPAINPSLLGAVRVPDGTMDALRLPVRFVATAMANGADIRPWTEVEAITGSSGCVTGVSVLDRPTGRRYDIGADIVVNAAGPWAGKIGALAGVEVPVRPSPGVLVALRGRPVHMVVSRLHPPGDGDIVLPQRGLSVLGTSSWLAEDPDDLRVPEDHVRAIRDEGARLVPALEGATVRAAWAAARPLVGARDGGSGRELSRTFKCFDHAADEGVEGLVTISGGKATTLRGMAELTADVVVRKLGIEAPCRTAETVLLPHTAVGRVERSRIPVDARRGAPSATAPGPGDAPIADVGRGPVRALRVARSPRGAGASVQETFVVPADQPRMTVLDALSWARRFLDPSLDVRHACFHASCGTCGMRVNGSEALACVTRLDDLPEGEIELEPLRGLDRVSDLVTDLELLQGDLDLVGPPLVRGAEPREDGGPPEGIDAWTRLEDCIECGLCLSACPVAAGDPAYGGPMVLSGVARAARATDDHHHAASLYSLVDDAQGAWRCHLAFACSDACPSGARPGEEIMRLRRVLIARHARHLLRLEDRAKVTT